MDGAEADDEAPPLFVDLVEDLQKKAIYCGVDVLRFWELTISEVVLIIEAFYERQKDEIRQQAIISYNNAYLSGLGSGIYHPMSEAKQELPPIEDIFPALFDNEKLKEEREEAERLAKLRREKAYLLMFAEQHNQQRKGTRSRDKGGE